MEMDLVRSVSHASLVESGDILGLGWSEERALGWKALVPRLEIHLRPWENQDLPSGNNTL